ncbi:MULTISPECIES: hypothetical protein [Alphaproteobacteria]|uniref:Lipoprotein n=2 Tax=Alphaproteobacteria TaxID=28211 RepID=A0A512HFX2_9HYPH|nr:MULTISPECIES: hypothetical protein [Alphaproteobacteria]GEO84349.1 hypothetical protein RNA01_12810 [Ciceribacter naphthalenivorans]GLR24886.1 hypothetical protein GCM10007920_46800 [Ciceribacter naphthalenivorans]GLT07742.1 hypothetical protein GCM10007926_46800 [Sphingomonas psychrolutea]
MKTLVLIAAVLSLSAGAAFGECGSHQTSASADVDRSMTTASVAVDQPGPADVVLLKQSRLPERDAVSTE